MRTTNTLTPIPAVAPAIPAILKALGLGLGAAAAADAISESKSDTIGSTYTEPTAWDLVKPVMQIETARARDFLSSIPDAYGNQMHRFLAMSSPRLSTVDDIPSTYVHAGWNRLNGGYGYYDPIVGRTTQIHVDPITINGAYTPYINTVNMSRGENLMPWNIISTTTPVGLTFDNTIMAAPLEGLYVAKKKKSKPSEQPVDSAKSSDVAEAGTPNPQPDPEKKDDNKDKNPESNNPDPKNQKDNWWKQRGKSFKDSFNRSAKAMSSGFTKGSDATMKAVGYALPPIMTIGATAGLGYVGYKLGEHFGLWGDENQSKPTSQQSSGDENIHDYKDTINLFRNIQWNTPE